MLKINDLVYVYGRPGKIVKVHPQKNTYDVLLETSKNIIEYDFKVVKKRYLHCKNCNRKLKGKPADNLCKFCRKDVK
jgi:hypothetical protein